MRATNRVINRVVLALAGLVLLAAGVLLIGGAAHSAGVLPEWLDGPAAGASRVWASAAESEVEIQGLGVLPLLLVVAAGAASVMALLLLVFLFTRRRGGSKDVLDVRRPDGRTAVDRNVADAVLTDPLKARPDVVSARTSAHRLKRTHAIELAVTVRPGASLSAVSAAAEEAIRAWDALLGSRVPIMLHLADRRWRDTFRARTRVR